MGYSVERFEALAAEIDERRGDIMLERRGEYSRPPDDVLRNFRVIAGFRRNRRPTDVCLEFLLKHIQSLTEAVDLQSYSWCWDKPGGGEGLKKRIADAINYLYLLAACIDEEATQSPEVRPCLT